MDSRDLRNLSEAWASATSCEDLCEEWLQERIEEGFDFSQNTVEELAEALKGSLMDKAKQDGAARGAAQGAAFKSFADRGGILGFLQRRLQSAVAQGGNPNRRGQGSGNRPAPTVAQTPAAPVTPVRPAAPARPAATADTAPAKPAGGAVADRVPSTSVAGTFKPVAGAPTQASLSTVKVSDKPNILGNKPSDLAAAQAKAKADSLAQAAKNRARGQRPMGARERMLNQDLDLFDIVKGYLLDEGATEEEVLKMMAVMTAEQVDAIVEGGINFSVPSRIDDFNNRRDELKNRYKQDVGPRIPGPGGGGQYGQPSAPKAMGVRLAKANSNSKNNA